MADETAGDSMDPGSDTASITTSGDGGEGGSVQEAPKPKTFNQSQVDALLSRQKQVFLTGKRDEYFKVPAELKELQAKAARADELEAEKLSEVEKLQKRAEEAESRAQAANQRVLKASLENAVLAEAMKRNVKDPDLVLDSLHRAGVEIEFGEDGTPSNVAAAMDALLEAKPHLIANGTTDALGSADQGARTPGVKQLTREQLKDMPAEAIVQARKEGRLDRVRGRI